MSSSLSEWKKKNPQYNNWDGYVSPGQAAQYQQMFGNKPSITSANSSSSGKNTNKNNGSSNVAVQSYNPYAEILRMQEEKLAQQKAAANAQYDTRVKNVNAGADEIQRQAYIAKMQDERQLPQQLKAVGVSGGLSETTLQNMTANYANNRNNTEAQRLQAIDQAAADRDAMNLTAYNDFLDGKMQTIQKYATTLPSTTSATKNSPMGNDGVGAKNTTGTIADNGTVFDDIESWVAFKRKQGFTLGDIEKLALSKGIVL